MFFNEVLNLFNPLRIILETGLLVSLHISLAPLISSFLTLDIISSVKPFGDFDSLFIIKIFSINI